MVKEHAKLAQEAEDGNKMLAELEELKKLHELAKVEMEQLKALPRAKISFLFVYFLSFNFIFDDGKIFRPLKSGSMLGAYRDKIDFTTIALKSTGSKFLEGIF
jgi:hypothetical protein